MCSGGRGGSSTPCYFGKWRHLFFLLGRGAGGEVIELFFLDWDTFILMEGMKRVARVQFEVEH